MNKEQIDRLIFELAGIEAHLDDAKRKLNMADVDWTAMRDIDKALASVRSLVNNRTQFEGVALATN